MRPPLLNPLFQSATVLKGIGPKSMAPLTRLVGGKPDARILDVLFHIPWSIIDRSRMPEIAMAPQGAMLVGPLSNHKGKQRLALPATVNIGDFRSLIIHCEQYDKLWGGADLK